MDAAMREVLEETGARMEYLQPLGQFLLKPPKGPTHIIPALFGPVADLGNRPESESRGIRMVSRADLSGIYYRWDPLLEAVFYWAEQQYLRLLRL